MKEVFVTKGVVILEDVPVPVCDDEGLVVKTQFSLISTGTERDAIKKPDSLLKVALQRPDLVKQVWRSFRSDGLSKTRELVESKLSDMIPLGYSSAGTVVEVGRNVNEFKVGDRVACAGAGYATHSEYAYIPKNLASKIPNSVSAEDACFATVGSIAMQGVRRSSAKVGENVVVIGMGLVGLLTGQILKAAGCNVICLEISQGKLELARKVGLEAGILIDGPGLVEEVERYTSGVGADSVIITAASKSNEPLLTALSVCRKKGNIVIVGNFPIEIPRQPLYEKELDVLISTSYGPGRYDRSYEELGRDYPVAYVRWTEQRNMAAFMNLVASGRIDLKPLVSQVFDIGDAENAYRVVLTQPVTAVLFSYGTEVGGFRRVYETPTAARRSGKIKVAIVGCGSFATTYHLPNLRRIDDYDIVAIIDHDPLKSKRLANQYGAKYYGSDYHELLDKTDIDLFLITTRHGSHAQITIDAADSKKDVFVEKPMALNQDELDKVVKAVTDNGIHYSVGFNRRFSPLALRAKEILSKLGGATMINCMINAGKLPGDYWVYDPKEGGGRIIGECCHFFDLFNFLIDSEAVSALGTSVLSNLPQFKSEDNIVATLKYRDGSIANLVYDSIGSNERPKERIEVLKAGRTLIIDDFRELAAYGCIGSLKLSRQDKGHYEELVQFARVIKGESASTISLEECARATRTTYEIAQMITGQKS